MNRPQHPAAAGLVVPPQKHFAAPGLQVEPYEVVAVHLVGAVVAGAGGDRGEGSTGARLDPVLVLVAVQEELEVLAQLAAKRRSLVLHQPVRRVMNQGQRKIRPCELLPQGSLLPVSGGPELPPLAVTAARPRRIEASEAEAQPVDLADRGPQRPLRIAEEVAEIVAAEEILVGAEATHQAPPLRTAVVDQLLDPIKHLPVQPLGLGFQDFPPIHVVVAGDEEKVTQRHLRREGPAHSVEELPGFAELLLDRLARRTAEVPEGGIPGEEDQIRPQAMIAL